MKAIGLIGTLLTLAIMGYLSMKRMSPSTTTRIDQQVEGVLEKGTELNAKSVQKIKKKLETDLQQKVQAHKNALQMENDSSTVEEEAEEEE